MHTAAGQDLLSLEAVSRPCPGHQCPVSLRTQVSSQPSLWGPGSPCPAQEGRTTQVPTPEAPSSWARDPLALPPGGRLLGSGDPLSVRSAPGPVAGPGAPRSAPSRCGQVPHMLRLCTGDSSATSKAGPGEREQWPPQATQAEPQGPPLSTNVWPEVRLKARLKARGRLCWECGAPEWRGCGQGCGCPCSPAGRAGQLPMGLLFIGFIYLNTKEQLVPPPTVWKAPMGAGELGLHSEGNTWLPMPSRVPQGHTAFRRAEDPRVPGPLVWRPADLGPEGRSASCGVHKGHRWRGQSSCRTSPMPGPPQGSSSG